MTTCSLFLNMYDFELSGAKYGASVLDMRCSICLGCQAWLFYFERTRFCPERNRTPPLRAMPKEACKCTPALRTKPEESYSPTNSHAGQPLPPPTFGVYSRLVALGRNQPKQITPKARGTSSRGSQYEHNQTSYIMASVPPWASNGTV